MLLSATAPIVLFVQPTAFPRPTTNSAKCADHPDDSAARADDPVLKFQKTQLCRFFPNCHKGAKCPFAHGRKEVRACPDLTKTELCSAWIRSKCPKPASACKYAHGLEDVRGNEGKLDVIEGVTTAPFTPPQLLPEDEQQERKFLDVVDVPSAADIQSSPGATATKGGWNLRNALSIGSFSHETLAPIVTSWLLDIKKLVSYYKATLGVDRVEHNLEPLHEALPTPEECRLALVMCMPDHYEE